MSVTVVYGNDAMSRRIAESVRIGKVPGEWLMNSKRKWNYLTLPWAMIKDTSRSGG